MYSREACEMYAELLKMASTVVEPHLTKEAGIKSTIAAPFKAMGNYIRTGATSASPRAVGDPGLLRRIGMRLTGRIGESTALPETYLPSQAKHMKDLIPPDTHNRVLAELEAAKQSGNAKFLGGAAIGGGLLGGGAYGIGRMQQKEQDKTQRNIAFGAGTALGLAAPSVLRGISNTAQNLSLSPASLIPGRY